MLIAQEIFYFLKRKKKGRKGFCVLKTDIAKPMIELSGIF